MSSLGMDEPIQVLAGTGGVALGEARTNHDGRKAVLLHRDGNPSELIALAETMGIEILDVQYQEGSEKTHVHTLVKVGCKTLQMKSQAQSKATPCTESTW